MFSSISQEKIKGELHRFISPVSVCFQVLREDDCTREKEFKVKIGLLCESAWERPDKCPQPMSLKSTAAVAREVLAREKSPLWVEEQGRGELIRHLC